MLKTEGNLSLEDVYKIAAILQVDVKDLTISNKNKI